MLAAGRNLLLEGPVGSGKSLLGESIAAALPPDPPAGCHFNCLPGEAACPQCRAGLVVSARCELSGPERFVRVQGSPDLFPEDLVGDVTRRRPGPRRPRPPGVPPRAAGAGPSEAVLRGRDQPALRAAPDLFLELLAEAGLHDRRLRGPLPGRHRGRGHHEPRRVRRRRAGCRKPCGTASNGSAGLPALPPTRCRSSWPAADRTSDDDAHGQRPRPSSASPTELRAEPRWRRGRACGRPGRRSSWPWPGPGWTRQFGPPGPGRMRAAAVAGLRVALRGALAPPDPPSGRSPRRCTSKAPWRRFPFD